MSGIEEPVRRYVKEVQADLQKPIDQLSAIIEQRPQSDKATVFDLIKYTLEQLQESFVTHDIILQQMENIQRQVSILWRETLGEKSITLPYNPKETTESIAAKVEKLEPHQKTLKWISKSLEDQARDTEK